MIINRFSIIFNFINFYLQLESLGSVRFLIFLKEASYAHQGCIYLIKNAVISNIVKYYYNLK